MNFSTVCSGIEAPSAAWNPIGWKAVFFSEIEKFPNAVLKHHYPETPNYGDMRDYKKWPEHSVDLIAAGCPCQSFSVAGFRKGLADPRGNLTLVYLGVVAKYRPRWVVYENVPGILSDRSGAFGALLGGLRELGYLGSYRILDAQYFGVPQRRRRVFLVGYLGDWRPPAAVLFEPESLSGNPPPRREAGKGIAAGLTSGSGSGGRNAGRRQEDDTNIVSGTLAANGGGMTRPAGNANELDFCVPVNIVTGTLSAGRSSTISGASGGNESTFCVPVAPTISASGRGTERAGESRGQDCIIAHSLPAEHDASEDGSGYGTPLIAIQDIRSGIESKKQNGKGWNDDGSAYTCDTLGTQGVAMKAGVRRLTPTECERLMGFPDGYTNIPFRGKPAADGPRYRALGNSIAVPVLQWLGRRIETVDEALRKDGAKIAVDTTTPRS